MHRRSRPAVSGLACLCLAACGGAPAPQDEAGAQGQSRDADETVFDDTIRTQDRARAVEGVTLGHKAELDAAIERSEDGPQDQQQ
jgi:hypothetical protein